jgi:hypothetical protein
MTMRALFAASVALAAAFIWSPADAQQRYDPNGNAYVNCATGCGGLASGAATAANQTAVQGTAGNPAATANTVQGIPGGTPIPVLSYAPATLPTSNITTPNTIITYTQNTGWCSATSACSSVFTFSNACRANGGEVVISGIDIYSSANPTIKLAGVLYLFNTTPGTIINDNATFTIASADFANLTGSYGGIPFTLINQQASGASNSGMTLAANLPARCASGSTTLIGMVEITNAYVRVAQEKLTINLHTVGVN